MRIGTQSASEAQAILTNSTQETVQQNSGTAFADIFAQSMQQTPYETVQPSTTYSSGSEIDGSTALMMCMMMSGGMEDSSGEVNDILSSILSYLLSGRDTQYMAPTSAAFDWDAISSASAGAASATANYSSTVLPYNAEEYDDVVQSALTRLGDPYSQQNAGEGDYTDCSYLSRWCYRTVGVELPRTAAAQAEYCVENGLTVSKDELQPGDLIFFSLKENGRYMNVSHVGIYAGNGMMVDASSRNGEVVYRPLFDGQVLYGRPTI